MAETDRADGCIGSPARPAAGFCSHVATGARIIARDGHAPMMSSPINVFQRLAQQWDRMHPYNAAQALKVAGPADLQRYSGAWHEALEALGLGRVRVEGSRLYYESLDGAVGAFGVKMPDGLSFEEHISQELNRRFDDAAEPPFRPFVIPARGHHYAGVVYHHWVADSVSIRHVLREWFVRVYDPRRARREPLPLARVGYGGFFQPFKYGGATARALLAAARWVSALRRARRLDLRGDIDLRVRFAVRDFEPGWLTDVHAAARRRGVTLNDLFLAAIATVCDRHVPTKLRRRRYALALGSIVDLRPYFGAEMSEAFGLFLGFTNVLCCPRDLRDRERLIRCIALQGQQQRRAGLPQASALRMAAGVAIGRLMSERSLPEFYQKRFPLSGGISNVNLTRSWATEYHPHPLLDYVRVSPTGPMMPLVFATTTLGARFHVALTYRPSVVGDDKVDVMTATFREFLSSL